jgi:hypothetical protein
MNTTHNRKKTIAATLGAAAAAVATPLMLFAGAGTAHADVCSPSLCVTYNNDAFGTVAHIRRPALAAGTGLNCNYHSNVSGQQLAFPFDAPVHLDGPTPTDLFIPGIELGTKWWVSVTCDDGSSVSGPQNF